MLGNFLANVCQNPDMTLIGYGGTSASFDLYQNSYVWNKTDT